MTAQTTMDFGVHLPHLGRQLSGETLREFAVAAEALGCHSLWSSDHVCWPADIASKYPYTDDGSFLVSPDMGWLDALGTLMYVAACTERVRLATSVLILPYRPPVLTAKQLATLDVLSNGRLILGAGVGWMKEEAAILGMPWDQRGKRSDEQIELMLKLFSDVVPEHNGEFYPIGRVGFEPKPIQNPVPIWIGGSSRAAFRRTAKYAEAFHAAFQTPDTVADEWHKVRQACEELGRDPKEVRLSLRVFLDPAGVMPPDHSLRGNVDEMLAGVARLRAIGVDHILLDPVARGGAAGRLEAVTRFLQDVAPKV